MTTQIHVAVERGNGWWVVTFSVDGTELDIWAKRLDQIDDMVADAASSMTGRPESDFIIDCEVIDARYVDLMSEHKIRVHEAPEAEHEAASTSRRVVAAMCEDGLPPRDVTSTMGVSPRRMSQLVYARTGGGSVYRARSFIPISFTLDQVGGQEAHWAKARAGYRGGTSRMIQTPTWTFPKEPGNSIQLVDRPPAVSKGGAERGSAFLMERIAPRKLDLVTGFLLPGSISVSSSNKVSQVQCERLVELFENG